MKNLNKIITNTDDLDDFKSILYVLPILIIVYLILCNIFYRNANIFIVLAFLIISYIICYGPLLLYILYKSKLSNEKN
jgi:hypothetical protein